MDLKEEKRIQEKPNAKPTVSTESLHCLCIITVVLAGNNPHTAKAVTEQLKIDDVITEVPMTNPILLQRLEGLVLLLAALALYAQLGQSWWLFLILLLVPDLFMLGYMAGSKVGAALYNVGHSLLWPVLLIGVGILVANPVLTGLGAIWLAHLGLDRVLGYGFKLPTGFKDTHLGRIGR
jgi:predicted RND superfamily exporter protein